MLSHIFSTHLSIDNGSAGDNMPAYRLAAWQHGSSMMAKMDGVLRTMWGSTSHARVDKRLHERCPDILASYESGLDRRASFLEPSGELPNEDELGRRGPSPQL